MEGEAGVLVPSVAGMDRLARTTPLELLQERKDEWHEMANTYHVGMQDYRFQWACPRSLKLYLCCIYMT